VNEPPTNTFEPNAWVFRTAIARTVPFVDPVQFWSSAPSDETWARFWRGTPPTAEKSPPRYQPPLPSEATARTVPATSGHGDRASAVEPSSFTDPPVYGATRPKLPPT
jgi:hypothetical protein